MASQQIEHIAHGQAHYHHGNLADQCYLSYTPEFLCPVILPAETNGCLVESIHAGIDETFQVGSGSVPCHGRGAKAVHRGLDQHIGDGEQGALEAGRHANLEHLRQLVRCNPHACQFQPVDTVRTDQAAEHQGSRDGLGDHSSNGHSRHPHGKYNHEYQVQHHIDHTGDQQIIQGPPGVPHGPENGTAKVIGHHEGHSHKIDPHIQHRVADHILRRAHPAQGRPGDKESHQHQDGTADHRSSHGCLYHLL